MPRRVWRSLDGPYVAPRPGDTVDLRGTTKDLAVQERKEILLQSYYNGVGSYFGGYSSITTVPGRPWTFDRGVKEGYGRVPWVHAAVRVIAISQSRLRFGVKDNDKPIGEGATELYDDPLIPLLNVRSNPVEYAYQLRQRASTQWMLSPRGGFIETVPPKRASNSKRSVELRLLPPGRTRIVPDKDGNIDHYEVDPVAGVGRPRPVPVERVRWFREPHPSDPFAGLTPLEAAGLSIEMDYFARLFNRQFMANDGRPGGIVAVTSPDGKGEPADEKELDRVERKFGGGPIDAGRLVVLDGTVTYEDVTKSARDMQWKDAGVAARNEIFGVFLVPVSAVDASGRTFSNAGQEWINFWTLMGQPHGDGFAWLFHDDVDGVPFLDYSKVAALQEAKQTQRAEWRDEVEQGLRTPLRYAQDTGQPIGDAPGEFPDQPGTRSLWLPAGKVPVASTAEDQVAAEKLAPVGTATQAAPMRGGAVDGGGDAGGGDQGGGGPGDGGGYPGGDGGYPEGKAARDSNLTKLATRRAARNRQLHAVGGGAHPLHDDEDKEDDRARPVEAALAAALTAMAQRQVGVTLARVRGTKARMGTRHWAPKPGEEWSTKQLDANDVVDPSQWGEQASAVAQANLGPLAQQQYDETRAQAEDDGGADVAAVLGPAVAGAAALLLAGEVAQLVTWLATSAANHGSELLAAIAEAERVDAARVAAGGQTQGIQPVVDAVTRWSASIPGWVQQVVPTSVAQAVEAGKHAVLSPLGDRVQREWRTKRDDKVRDAHKAAEGQVAKGGEPFIVGAEPLRYPRDPLGSPGNVINCRCRTRWRLAARAQQKQLAAGGDVIAAVLALPAPAGSAARLGKADECVPGAYVGSAAGGASWLRYGEQVSATAALEGVADRDHVGEMLGGPETKVRRVRTAGGVRRYHLPEGSPIVAHPLHGLGGRDHAGAVASDAERTTAARRELADRMGTATALMRGGMPSGGPSPFPGGQDKPDHPQAAKLREQAIAYNRDAEGWHDGIEAEIRAAQPQARVLMPDAPAGTGKSTPGKVIVYRGFQTSEGWIDAGDPEVRTLPAIRVQRTGDAARALRTEGRRTGLPFQAYKGQVTDSKRWADAEDPPDALPSGDGPTGDMAKAKAELAGKGKDVAGLMAGGMTAADAAKEYARLLHNARFRYRRDRLKAEKAAGGKAVAAAADDAETPEPKQSLAELGQQLLDAPDDVKADLAGRLDAEPTPKAIYSAGRNPDASGPAYLLPGGAPSGKLGPGAVRPGGRWFDRLTKDFEPVPVIALDAEAGYHVAHGLAFRRGGVAYLVETAGPADMAEGSADRAKLEQAAKTMEMFLGTVPEERRMLQRGVSLHLGKNPKDKQWASLYNTPGFTSAATGGRGGTTFWAGNAVHPGLAAHEYGHNLDSGVYLPNEWLSEAGPVLPGQTAGWEQARAADDATQAGVKFRAGADFVETRPDPSHPITLGGKSVTAYGENHPKEDFAESVRLYLKDRREGKLGYVKPPPGQTLGTTLRFADLWPERAKVLDAAFGVESEYDTPWAKQQRAAATADLLAFLHAQHDAEQMQGHVPASPQVEDVARKHGLSIPNAVAAYGAAQDQYAKDLATKNEGDALEHVKELLSGQANTPESGQVAEIVADLMDGFDLDEEKADEIAAAGISWQAQQQAAKKLHDDEVAAKLAAEAAVQDVVSLADLPKETQTVIRKRRANVKLRAKQKGASAEQAEAVAAAYEAEQIAKEAKKLGLSGQVVGAEIVKGKVADVVKGPAAGPALRVKPQITGASKGAATWLNKAGADKAPHAAGAGYGGYSSYGKPQQAKSNIAATLAVALNNKDDWETFRTYANSGAGRGYNLQFEYPKTAVPGWAETTFEERQKLLDAEVATRIQMWASTSGDSNPFAVMMQQAVKDELGVPGPVGVNASNGATQQEVDKRYPHVSAFYRRVIRTMYEDTQKQLAADGIEWVPLYRGMKIQKGAHDWARESDGHHVPLQPASSFSTAPNVSYRFGSMMARGLVHRSMILGSARTGFGCLNEKEWVVLASAEDDASWQVRFVGSGKAADIKAAFAKPPKAPMAMTVNEAQAAIKKALGGQPLSPGMLFQRLAQTPAGQPVNYPIGGTAGVNLPRDAVLAFLDHYGYDVGPYTAKA